MAPIAVGDTIPKGTLPWFDENDRLKKISIHSLAAGKKIVLIGVLGAFTPTCSMQHVPSFVKSTEELKSKGMDEILVISVNDPYVMKVWAKSYTDNKHVKFLADGSANYTKALSLKLDLSENGKCLNGLIKISVEREELREFIVKDSVYPLLTWLMIPYEGKGVSVPMTIFNAKHKSVNLIAIRALSQLKGL